jgi:hypothetical protein
MKGLMSTAASRAWLGVALAGLVVVVLVFALALVPRLPAGQQVLDRAGPAFSGERVAATRAGVDLLSQYVDLAGPLLTSRGEGAREGRSLVRLVRRELGISSAQARKILRREAPRTEALLRAMPLERIAAELPALTSYLAATLTMTEDDLAATLERRFPDLAQVLTELPLVADTWYDVPGVEGLTRPGSGRPVRTVPGLRSYYRDDLVPRVVEHGGDVRGLASRGGVGYIPYLLLIAGIGLLGYGVLQARRAATTAPGAASWGVVVAAGVVLAAIVVGKWNPALAAVACLLFGAADAFQLSVQALGFVTIPSEFFVMLPYILTVAALAGLVGRTRMPRKLGIPYSSSAEV